MYFYANFLKGKYKVDNNWLSSYQYNHLHGLGYVQSQAMVWQGHLRQFLKSLRVYLFGGILDRIENWGEKSGEKCFLMGVWLGGERKKMWWSPSVFSPSSPKCFPQNVEKTGRGKLNLLDWWKCPCALAHGFCPVAFFFLSFVCVCVCARARTHLSIACAIY